MRVFAEDRLVGQILFEDDEPVLTYDADWRRDQRAFPISTAFPLSKPGMHGEKLIAWLANLLPEGDHLHQVASRTGISEGDILALVERMGRETSGALSFAERGNLQKDWREILDEAALERMIEELPERPFLVGEEGVSLSLAGAQTKMGVCRDEDGRLYIPVNGSASTHILKPDIKRLLASVESEALCLTLAKRIGLAASKVTMGRAGDRKYLLVERYDRVVERDRVTRLHQEDFCQALGVFPTMKYQTNNTGRPGPSLQDMALCLRRVADSASLLQFLDGVIFNVLVCNPDSHAKNYSMMIGTGKARLAPLYDIMCAACWGGINMKMANKIAGKVDGAHLKGRHWQREARLWGLNTSLVLKRVSFIADKVLREVGGAVDEVAEMPASSAHMLNEFREAISMRTRQIKNGLMETEEV